MIGNKLKLISAGPYLFFYYLFVVISCPNLAQGNTEHVCLATITGDWSGQLNAGFQKINVIFHLKENSCTLDVPDQGAFGIAGIIELCERKSVKMVFKSIGGSFDAKIKDGKLQGMWKQGFSIVPLTLYEGMPVMRRPQEPQPPFPYQTETVSFTNIEASLEGTLTTPNECCADTPVLLMVTGSGSQNRDEEMFNHKPFAVIADFLAKQGIASLRYDDRGVGKSQGKTKNISIENIMLDAESGIEFLRKHFNKVGILGHSEGGTIAFMLAARKKVDFVISMAGSALKLGDVLDEQLRARLQSVGKNEREIAKELPTLKQTFVNDDGIRHYFDYDPIVDIKATHCPVFALNGEKDTQVICEQHLPILRNNLTPKDKMLIKSYPNLNHLFQHCQTGEYLEYAKIEETISPEVLDDIASFITKYTNSK